MSISLYSGTPGSGKSYHAARDIISRLKRGGGLICNFPIKEHLIPDAKAKVTYWDNSELTPERLVSYALANHAIGVEGQCLVIIDEAQLIFNSREFGRKDRQAWITLFSQHRKLGYNFILIAQHDRMLDRQIRALIEDEVKHRKLNNAGFGGMMLSLLTGKRTWFIAITYWYGGHHMKLYSEVFMYRKRVAAIYDSYRLFSDMTSAGGAVCAGGNRASGGAPGNGSTGQQGGLRKQYAQRLVNVLATVIQQDPDQEQGGAA